MTRKLDLSKKMTAAELPECDILEAGTAAEYETGGWRNKKPVWLEENCIQCMFCWINCPDSAVIVEAGKMKGFNFKHCKGCGICEEQCPGKKGVKAIKMVPEREK